MHDGPAPYRIIKNRNISGEGYWMPALEAFVVPADASDAQLDSLVSQLREHLGLGVEASTPRTGQLG